MISFVKREEDSLLTCLPMLSVTFNTARGQKRATMFPLLWSDISRSFNQYPNSTVTTWQPEALLPRNKSTLPTPRTAGIMSETGKLNTQTHTNRNTFIWFVRQFLLMCLCCVCQAQSLEYFIMKGYNVKAVVMHCCVGAGIPCMSVCIYIRIVLHSEAEGCNLSPWLCALADGVRT